ncbi:MAG: hypothetical protein UHK60_04105 [Acutalibacteraceae bacterium]|nr:hypothetical protein [Acutalibacteraceae bacterium]
MKARGITKFLSTLLCSAVIALSFASCGKTEVVMTSNTANGKTTQNGIIEYQDAYFIVDTNGINYKSAADKKSIVIAHTSKANGKVQKNFAIGDEKIYFITTQKGQAKTLFQCDLNGKKRKKLIVRDDINIVGVYNNAVYFYDEQNFLKCIDGTTGSKTEISIAYGAPFYQYNNCFIHKASDGILEAYNCDDGNVIPLSDSAVSSFNVTSTGVTYAINNSDTKDSFEYSFNSFNYDDMLITPMHKSDSSKAVDVMTETVALTNFKDHLQICDIDSGKNNDQSYKTEGKIIYDTAVSPNAYYVNDNVCLKFSTDNAEPQKINVNYKKHKIDYNNIIAVVNDKYIVSLDAEGYYSFNKMP